MPFPFEYRMEFLDDINESDYSEEDIPHWADYRAKGSVAEVDMMRPYWNFLIKNLDGIRCTSTAVQTEPEVSGIPRMWLIAFEKRVNDLHTGLGNMINKLYHMPYGYCNNETDAVEDPNKLKNYTFVEGYWQSKLHPHIKIPASGMGKQLYSEDFKKDLNNLLQTTLELKGIIPYVADFDLETDIQAVDNYVKSFGNVQISRRETKRTRNLACFDSQITSSSTYLPQSFGFSFDSDSIRSDYSSQSTSSGCRPNIMKYTVNTSCERIAKEEHVTSGECGKQNPAATVSKYNLKHRGSNHIQLCVPKQTFVKHGIRSVKSDYSDQNSSSAGSGHGIMEDKAVDSLRKPLAAVSEGDSVSVGLSASGHERHLESFNAKFTRDLSKNNVTNQPKRTNQESSKGVSVASGSKNFIRRNILASKVPMIRKCK